jgi:hypothetical protein
MSDVVRPLTDDEEKGLRLMLDVEGDGVKGNFTARRLLATLDRDRAAQPAAGEGLDVERLATVRHLLVNDIGAALSAALAQGDPFEPYDRIYVAKTITRVLDEARDRINVAAGSRVLRSSSEVPEHE